MLLANVPQLLLSLAFLFYNAIITRFVAAREWGSLASAYRPLRVTQPAGEQVSTYFLTVPYAIAVPGLAISAVLHWLVSESIYVLVAEGGLFPCGFTTPWLPACG